MHHTINFRGKQKKICGFKAVSMGTKHELQRPGTWLTHQLCSAQGTCAGDNEQVMPCDCPHIMVSAVTGHIQYLQRDLNPEPVQLALYSVTIFNYQFKLASTKMSGYSHVCRIAIGNSRNRADTEGV